MTDVTVVVPVYNTMPYLLRCLDSLVEQTIGPDRMEVVAVDDGSTDGSGETLDRYAEEHADLFRVVHQENSGGPARPCNVGLDLATGRYVFFLGADDYLGTEALERMVGRADEWGTDVMCARLVGVGGRWVSQKLYASTQADVPFPSAELASALSNTKLFRRALIEDHALRFLELPVGEDQPFTIAAMLHARRISVLADYDYYFAVKREDEQNITYTATWRARLAGIGTVVEQVASLLGPGDARDVILTRHFAGEISTLLRRDFPALPEQEQSELVAEVARISSAYLTEPIMSRLRVLARLRYRSAEAGDIAHLRRLVGAEGWPVPLRVRGDRLVLAYPLPESVSEQLVTSEVETVKALAVRLLPEVALGLDGPRLLVEGRTALEPDSAPAGRVVLVRAKAGRSPDAARYPLGGTSPRLAEPLLLHPDGGVRANLDLTGLLPKGDVGSVLWAPRVQWDIGAYTFSVPLTARAGAESVVSAIGHEFQLATVEDDLGHALVEVRTTSSGAEG